MPVRLFAIFWSACTLIGVFFGAKSFIGGLQTYSFSETTGIVTNSTLKVDRDSDGATYRAEVMYKYTVQGQHFTGDRLRYGAMGTSDQKFTQGLVSRYKKNAKVSVYYDPSRPSEAVLEKGVSRQLPYLTIFFTPFVTIMIGLWLFVARGAKAAPGGVEVIEDQLTTRARLSHLPPHSVGLIALCAATFIATFAVALTAGVNAAPELVAAVWLLILSIVFGFYFWHRKKIASGRYDLVLDYAGSILTLPRMMGRKEEIRIPLRSIEAVSVEKIERSNDGSVIHRWIPTFLLKDGEAPQRLNEWPDRDNAESFAKWLGEKLGAPVVLPTSST